MELHLPSLFRSIAAATALALTATTAHAQLAPCKPASVFRPPESRQLDTDPMGLLKPAPKNSANCTLGARFTPEPGVTLWRCLIEYPEDVDPPEDAWDHATLIQQDGKPMQVFQDDIMAGRYKAFHVIRADLDGDGSDERVLALWNSAGNGMGINGWTIHVFTNTWTPIARIDNVLDWGRSSVVAAPKGRKGCDLAITDWVESRNAKGVDGVSLKATFHRLANGKLEPATDRPALQRRYTFAFQKQRTQRYDTVADTDAQDEGDVATWLSHASTTRAPG